MSKDTRPYKFVIVGARSLSGSKGLATAVIQGTDLDNAKRNFIKMFPKGQAPRFAPLVPTVRIETL